MRVPDSYMQRPKMPINQRPFRQRISYRPYTLPNDAECINGIWYSESENRRMLVQLRAMNPNTWWF